MSDTEDKAQRPGERLGGISTAGDTVEGPAIRKASSPRTGIRDADVRNGPLAVLRGNADRRRGSVAAPEGEPPCA